MRLRSGCREGSLHIVNRLSDALDPLNIAIGDVQVERLFERQDELENAARIGAELTNKRLLAPQRGNVHVELLGDDTHHFLGNIARHGKES